jgi:putative transposase
MTRRARRSASSSVDERRRRIEPKHPAIPITRQREPGLARASDYHRPEREDAENLRLIQLINETHLAHPCFGSRQMTRWLRWQREPVNRKRVRRLMRWMGLVAICPKPNLSRKQPQHVVFPYLLRELDVTRPN